LKANGLKDLVYICVQGLKETIFKRNFAEVGGKNDQLYVLLALANYCSITSFDLWMLKGAYDIFSIVINVLGAN